MTSPDLSIVVAAQGTPQQTLACLRSLLAQIGMEPNQLEIIVAEGPPYASTVAIEQQFPSVKFIKASGTAIPILHGRGIHASSAPLVAITEAHCTFPNNWFKQATDSHRRYAASVIGGAVMPGPSVRSFNMALFLCDYAQFVPPIQGGPNFDLPGNNVVFKRICLGETAKFVEHGFWKTFYCHELAAQGHELISDPNILVYYNRELSIAEIISRRYNHGRCFGAMRAEHSAALKRFTYFFSGPALPALLTYKLSQRCLPNSECARQFLACAPAAFACVLTWSIGEWIGNLAGAGTSCAKL